MNHFQLARFIGIIGLLFGCATRSDPEDSSTKNLKLPELSQEPLGPAVSLTADYFKASYPHLSAEQFQKKWQHSKKSGLLFMRSFVNTWYDEVSRMSSTGPIGPCLGDPHPENFGYLAFGSGFVYVYNDADDSGACPVIFDALRYFTTLKLTVKDNLLESELRRAYVRFLNGEELVERPSRALAPERGKTLEKILSRNTKKNKIKLEGPQKTLPTARAQSLFILLKDQCADCKVLDAVEWEASSGGSAGLKRYWLLVENQSQGPMLIEWKELSEPASQRGAWAQKQKLTRTAILEDVWAKDWPQFFAFVTLDDRPFLMRSRLSADLPLDTLNPALKKAILTEQVYLLAQLHRKTLSGSTLLEEWLGRQSEFQARRYGEALLAAQGE